MKRCLAFVAFFALIYLSQSRKIDQIVKYLANADTSTLSDSLKSVAEEIKVSLSKAGSEHSYCCAIQSQTSTTETRTRVISIQEEYTTKIIVGYKPCTIGGTTNTYVSFPSLQQLLSGFNLTGTFPAAPTTPAGCQSIPIYEEVTYMKTKYLIEYYTVTIVTSNCPIEHQICCDGYTMLSGNCVDNAVVGNLQQLINLGLIG